MGPSRRRLGVIFEIVIVAYVVALAALPFAHHELVCHLKSTTHCSGCHIGTADSAGVEPGLGSVRLADAGLPAETSVAAPIACPLRPSSGRSPPPATSL